jgi:hypothetical protein
VNEVLCQSELTAYRPGPGAGDAAWRHLPGPLLLRVNDGNRTRDIRHHKPALCLLSYIHHEGRQRAEPEGGVSLLICRPARTEGLEPPAL